MIKLQRLLLIITLSLLISCLTAREQKYEPKFDPFLVKKDTIVSQSYDEWIPALYRVPLEELENVKEYGFSFWMRYSYSEPRTIYTQDSLVEWASIAGITEESNYCVTQEHGFRALTLWMSEFSRTCSPVMQFCTYDLAKNNSNSFKNIMIDRSDLDYSWNFIYFSFSQAQQKAVAYWKSSFTQQVFLVDWEELVHNSPPKALTFKLGSCGKNRYTFNGQYQGIYFSHQDGVFLDSKAAVEQWMEQNALLLPPPPRALDNSKISVIGSNGLIINREKASPTIFEYDDYQGASEYAVWGWVQFEQYQGMQDRNFIFRLSTNQPDFAGDKNYMGDRTLMAQLSHQGIYFVTYNLGFNKPSVLSEELIAEYPNQEADLKGWQFLYFGYNYRTKRAAGFLKLESQEKLVMFNDIWHVVPNFFSLSIGCDRFFSNSFNGKMKNWYVQFGQGAFVERNYQIFYSDMQFEQEAMRLEFQETINEERVIDSSLIGDASVSFEVPKADLAKIGDVSMAFWLQFSHIYPTFVENDIIRNHNTIIATVTELGSCKSKDFGSRKFQVTTRSLSSGHPAYEFKTYDINQNLNSYEQAIEFSNEQDFDGAWNYIYYAYSHESKELVAFVYYSKSGRSSLIKFNSSQHLENPTTLKFFLGKCSDQAKNKQFNGVFFDPKFRFQGMSYIDNKDLLLEYVMKKVKKPFDFISKQVANIPLIQGEKEFSSETKDPFKIDVPEAISSDEYSIYGWFKLTKEPYENKKQMIFRVTEWNDDIVEDKTKEGDRTFALVYMGSQFYYITYSFGYAKDTSIISWVKNVDNIAPINTWIWVYFGYNYNQKTALFNLYYEDQDKTTYLFKWNDVLHYIPNVMHVYLGKDKFMRGSNVILKDWVFQAGIGAYRESKLLHLRNPDLQTEENVNQNELNVQMYDSYWRENKVKEIKISQEDLTGIKSVGFSLWFKFSYTDPQRIPIKILRTHKLGFFGITEDDDYCHTESKFGRALAVWLRNYLEEGEPYLTIQTYDLNENIPNKTHQIRFDPWDVDGSWNWVYFAYSYEKKELFGQFFFRESKVWYNFSLPNIAHNPEPKQLKLILGRCGDDQGLQFNGQLYNVKLEVNNKFSFINNPDEVVKYYEQRTIPAYSNPSQQIIPVQKCLKLLDQQSLGIPPYTWRDQYRGAEEYSVWGWIQWLPKPNRYKYHSIFRFTINDPFQYRNDETLGDRAMAAWYGDNELIFSVYNFSYVNESSKNLYKSVKLDVEDDSWIFIYMGVSYYETQATVLVKFAEREEMLVWDNLWVYIPKYMRLHLGYDGYYAPFNGQLKNWYISLGIKSYYYQKEDILLKSQNQLCKGYINPDLDKYLYTDRLYYKQENESTFTANAQPLNPYKAKADDTERQSGVQAFYTWFRWSYSMPEVIQEALFFKDKQLFITQIIEDESIPSLSLSITNQDSNPAFNFSTYSSLSKETISKLVKIDWKNFPGQWSWVYFGYDQNQKSAYYAVYFSRTKELIFDVINGIVHNDKVNSLTFIVGKQNQNQLSYNGFILRPRPSFVSNNIYATKELLQELLNKEIEEISPLPTFQPLIILSEIDYSQPIQIPEFQFALNNKLSFKEWDGDFNNVNKYAVFGWACWTGGDLSNLKGNQILFRMTVYNQSIIQDQTFIGDRELAVFINQDHIEFSTYSLLDGISVNKNVQFKYKEGLLNQWFWVYYGYSGDLYQTRAYIQWADGSTSDQFQDNVLHIIPYYHALYLGTDANNYNEQLQGKVKDFYAIFGENVYFPDKIDIESIYNKFNKNFEVSIIDQEDTSLDDSYLKLEESDQAADDDDKAPIFLNFNDGGIFDVDIVQNDQAIHHPKGTYRENKVHFNYRVDNESDIIIENDCGYIFNSCYFQGKAYELCQGVPQIDNFGSLKSIIVPEGKKITVYTKTEFQGLKAEFFQTVDCLKSLDYRFLLKNGIKITRYPLNKGGRGDNNKKQNQDKKIKKNEKLNRK